MYRIAIVGRPNVGKSTLFNRLIGKKKSIIADEPGVTRDRIYGETIWLGNELTFIDTGGLTNENLPFIKNITEQVQVAIDEADLIIFLVSLKDGINNDDKIAAKLIKKSKKQTILIANKSENNKYTDENKFYSLGFDKPIYISAEHGIGINLLFDEIIKFKSNIVNNEKKDEYYTKLCLIGRTNVGKSTLMNAILNKERSIVSEKEHTTRDAIDEEFNYHQKKYLLIDTAGIRRKGKVKDNIEKFAVLRTESAVGRTEMILFVIDGSDDFKEQDEVIGGIAYKSNIPTIIVVNKWDSVKKDTNTMNKYIKVIREKFRFLSWCPIVFISAKDKKNIQDIFKEIDIIKEQLKIHVSSSILNDVIAKAQLNNPTPKVKGGRLKIDFATQVNGQVPSFVLFVNKPNFLHFTYARYIENRIREAFGLTKVPILVYYKDKNARIRTTN